MSPHETALEAALVHADSDAEMRAQITQLVTRIAEDVVRRMVHEDHTLILVIGANVVVAREHDIRKIALRAIKEQFLNPQQIY